MSVRIKKSFQMFGASLAMSLSVLGAGQVSAQGLQATMEAAYENSDLLEQNRYLARVADEGIAQRVAALRPTLNMVAQRARTDAAGSLTETIALTADLVLFASGSRSAQIAAARASAEATQAQLLGLEGQVLLDAVTAYTNVWRDVQVVNVRQSNLRVVEEQLRAARDRFDLGEATRTDVAQAEAQMAAARSALAAAQGTLSISRELYQLAVGVAPEALGAPGARPELPASAEAAEMIARSSAPLILAAQHEVTANQHNLTAARAAYGPTVSMSATSTDTREGAPNTIGNSERLSLTITQPIYQGGRLASLERTALANLAASQSNLSRQTATVIQNLGNAYARLSIASAQIAATEQQINAAQLAFEGVREEASLGARTTLDVLNAEQDLLDARIARIQAQTDLYTASYSVLNAMGGLTAEAMGLDVELYDADAYGARFSGAPLGRPSVQGSRLDGVLERLGRE